MKLWRTLGDGAWAAGSVRFVTKGTMFNNTLLGLKS